MNWLKVQMYKDAPKVNANYISRLPLDNDWVMDVPRDLYNFIETNKRLTTCEATTGRKANILAHLYAFHVDGEGARLAWNYKDLDYAIAVAKEMKSIGDCNWGYDINVAFRHGFSVPSGIYVAEKIETLSNGARIVTKFDGANNSYSYSYTTAASLLLGESKHRFVATEGGLNKVCSACGKKISLPTLLVGGEILNDIESEDCLGSKRGV